MASQVYSLRIFAHAQLDPAGGKVGPIVPEGLVYVLRDIDAFDLDGTTANELEVFNPLGSELVLFQGATTIPARNNQWRGRQVYSAGEQVAFQTFTGKWSVMASGYQLTLP